VAIPRALEPSGLVLVDKPSGPSSFALVRDLRSKTGARAGHAGTLDPFASGLLLVLLGSATRLARYLVGLDKRYLTEIDLSSRTASGDLEGEIIETKEAPARELLEESLHRRGEAPEMPLRRSRIDELQLLDYSNGIARLDLRVSSGTYVRAIADRLGGHCHSLRRLEVGPFSVSGADSERIHPAADAVPFLPALELSEEETDSVRAGRQLQRDEPGLLRLCREGRLIAVGLGKNGTVRPETVMPV
jgi:tRNA pseudouridine55 synthase